MATSDYQMFQLVAIWKHFIHIILLTVTWFRRGQVEQYLIYIYQ